jgi:hypothetical protein
MDGVLCGLNGLANIDVGFWDNLVITHRKKKANHAVDGCAVESVWLWMGNSFNDFHFLSASDCRKGHNHAQIILIDGRAYYWLLVMTTTVSVIWWPHCNGWDSKGIVFKKVTYPDEKHAYAFQLSSRRRLYDHKYTHARFHDIVVALYFCRKIYLNELALWFCNFFSFQSIHISFSGDLNVGIW